MSWRHVQTLCVFHPRDFSRQFSFVSRRFLFLHSYSFLSWTDHTFFWMSFWHRNLPWHVLRLRFMSVVRVWWQINAKWVYCMIACQRPDCGWSNDRAPWLWAVLSRLSPSRKRREPLFRRVIDARAKNIDKAGGAPPPSRAPPGRAPRALVPNQTRPGCGKSSSHRTTWYW